MRGEKISPRGNDSVGGDALLKVPDSVPQIDGEVLDGATRRSARARRLHARLQQREAEGKPLSASEVDDVVKGCKKADGKVDGDQAVVLAAHARRNPRLFRGGHAGLLRLLARVVWRTLIGDLRAFIADIREREAQERHKADVKRSLEQDTLEHETRKIDLGKQDRLKADVSADAQKPVDAKLDADNRLLRTLAGMKRP